MADEVVLAQYRLGALLGSGAFSKVFEAEDLSTGAKVAVKLEDLHKRNTSRREVKLLQGKLCYKGIPKVIRWEREGNHSIEVMELLGDSLFKIVREKGRKPALETLYRIFNQTIHILKYIHRRGYVHADIKPDNLVLGGPSHPHRVYLIDFCEAKKYATPSSPCKSFVGNPYFTSTAVLRGCPYSPRDDLEAMAYVFAFLSTGTLPWIDVYDIDPEVCIRKVIEARSEISLHEEWIELPQLITDLVDYARNLEVNEMPNYSEIIDRIDHEAKTFGIGLFSKAPLWESCRRKSLGTIRTDTIKIPLGVTLHIGSQAIHKLRCQPHVHSRSSACSSQSNDTTDQAVATLVSSQLPVMSPTLREQIIH